MCHLKYSAPKKVSIVFHSESNYDYHFIIKRVSNPEKYITFSVPIEEEVTRIDKKKEMKLQKPYPTD